VSALRSAADLLASTDLGGFSDSELVDELAEVSKVLDIVSAQLLRLTAEVDRRRSFSADGFVSIARFLAVACDLANSTAREKVMVARALESMPRVSAALAAGDLSYSKVRVLARAAAAHPEPFVESEEVLVEVAGRLTVRDLFRVVEYWRQNLDGPGAMVEMVDRSYAYVSRSWEGMVKIDALLDPEAGETVITALEASMIAPAACAALEPQPTAGRRRAEALVDVCRSYLDRGEATVGGERPHVTVLVDLETLENRTGWVCELEHTGTVPAETARRLACDAHLSRVITRGRSQPLDVGRMSRTVTVAQRRAVIVRDRQCRFPGCDRPPRWGDIHHIVHWADGGASDLDNLIVVCRRHHTLLHEGGFGLTGTARAPTFTRPDHTPLDP
jgi:hypothetical protein